MLQHYKLRLSDGTVLLVDQDGLGAWLEDAKAMVQAAGSNQWRPLKELVWEVRASAKRTAQQDANARAALPLIPPPPRLREEETLAPPLPPPPPTEPTEVPTIEESPGLQVLFDDPAAPLEEPASHPRALEEDSAAIPAGPHDHEAPLPPAAPSWRESLEPPLLDASSTVQVLADEPMAQPADDRERRPSPTTRVQSSASSLSTTTRRPRTRLRTGSRDLGATRTTRVRSTKKPRKRLATTGSMGRSSRCSPRSARS